MSPTVEETAPVTQPETVTQEEKAPETQKDPSQVVADALSTFAGAPTRDQIETWKQQFGEVFCSGFAETELFIWRPISRAEFVKMQAQVSGAKEQLTNLDVEGIVVDTCILWASDPGKKSLTQKAGSLTALHEQVMANSNFMDPRLATALVIRL